MRSCPASLKGQISRIREVNPPLYQRLTKNGPLALSGLELTCWEVGATWFSTGSWDFTEATLEIVVPRARLADFRLGVARVMEALHAKARHDAALETKKSSVGR